MSITEDAPAPAPAARRSPVRLPGPARRASPWWWLVGASVLVLAAVAAVLGAWWAASSQTRTVISPVTGALSAIDLDVGAASVDVAGGAIGTRVVRTEEYAFGRPPRVTLALDGSVLRVASRCPDTIVGRCRARFRLEVPDNVLVSVRTTSGRVAITGLNGSARVATGSGAVAVDAFCGFSLTVTSEAGPVSAGADCSPDRIELRSAEGDVRAVVPAGRYRVEAHSDHGSARVRDVIVADDAVYAVQALSGSGDVSVEAGR